MTENMIKVKVIWNVVWFVKGSEVEITENVYKAYGKEYFEKIWEKKEAKTTEKKKK